MKVDLYDQNLKKLSKKVEISDEFWKRALNEDLVAQAVYVYSSNRRQGTAAAKGRGDVRGGGRKPRPQKGTGRSRAGSIRSPLWIGGGVHFPPTGRNWKKRMNRKMKNVALSSVLSQMLRDEDLYFVDLKKVDRSAFKGNEKYMVLTRSNDVRKKLSNMPNVRVFNPLELNALNALEGGKIYFDVDQLEEFEKRFQNGG